MLELATSLIFLVSSLYPQTAVAETTASVAPTEASAKVIEVKDSKQVEAYVKSYFADNPILAEIARCESTYRQLDEDGQVLRGIVNTKDVGVMQINETYHAKQAEKLGLDLHDFEDNLAYAKQLYEKQGTQPWISSKPCWGPKAKQLALATK